MKMGKLLFGIFLGMCWSWMVSAEGVSIEDKSYLKSGFYVNQAIPVKGTDLKFTVRTNKAENLPESARAELKISDWKGNVVQKADLVLKRNNAKCLNGEYIWTLKAEGVFKAELFFNKRKLELIVPVISGKRKVHSVWFTPMDKIRFATLFTASANQSNNLSLLEHGIIPLRWSTGGMHFRYKGFERDVDIDFQKKIEIELTKKYSSRLKVAKGFGIDEFGGYPGSLKERASIAGAKAIVNARKRFPSRIFAAWHSGGIREGIIGAYRKSVDFLLLETYVFRAIPEDLGNEYFGAAIRNRLEPLLSGADMLVPAYGNKCKVLIALDTSERPDFINTAEMEEVVRFIRQNFPELRGMAWYNGGFRANSPWGIKELTSQIIRKNQEVITKADSLMLRYFMMPCITFLDNSFWYDPETREITAALSNIGAMEAKQIKVSFYIDGKKFADSKAETVPVGNNRLENRFLFKKYLPNKLNQGTHEIEVKIDDVGFGSVLESAVSKELFISK